MSASPTPSSPLSSLSSLSSSPLSSIASRSPSPPADYPSPPSSAVSELGLSSGARSFTASLLDSDGPPPPKKRKVAGPRELKTEYLDLRALRDSPDATFHNSQEVKVKKLAEALHSKRKIVVIAGAGISVSAGIPDFRSSKGLFSTLRSQHKLKASGKHLFDASVYKSDSSTSSFHAMVRELSTLTQNAKATEFHHMLATLAEEGRLLRLYTQNVDGIDTNLEPLVTQVPLSRKGPWPKTIQLHGGLEKMVCSKCGHLSDFNATLFDGPEPPPCPECEAMDTVRTAGGLRSHGIGRLRPRMVLYNEFNPDEEAIGAVSHADLKSRPDAVVVVGTSLKVPGIRRLAKEMCSVTRGRRGGFTAWINHDPEPVGVDFKDCWDMVVRGECDDVAYLAGLPKWNETKTIGDYTIVDSTEVKPNTIPAVILKSKPITAAIAEGILTPGASPRHNSPVPIKLPTKGSQQKLSFALPAAQAQEAPKFPKKRGRKPLPNGRVNDSKIDHVFPSTKPSLNATTGQSKHSSTALHDLGSALDQKLRASLDRGKSSNLKQEYSPFGNSVGHPLRLRDDDKPQIPTTPRGIGVLVPYKDKETVSPTAIPRGMGFLLS